MTSFFFHTFVLEPRIFRSATANIIKILVKKFLEYYNVNFCVGTTLSALNQGKSFLRCTLLNSSSVFIRQNLWLNHTKLFVPSAKINRLAQIISRAVRE